MVSDNRVGDPTVTRRAARLALGGAALLALLAGCAPEGVYMTGGDKLDERLSTGKPVVAVLPFVDQNVPSGFCGGYTGAYGCGVLTVKPDYDNFDLVATNGVVSSLWKKNRLKVVKRAKLVEAVKGAHLKADDIFPKANYTNPTCCGNFPKPIAGTQEVGEGVPNYDALYDVGAKAGADVLIIGRVNRDETAIECSSNPIGGLYEVSPFLVLIPLLDIGYRMARYEQEFISIDVMALDCKKREVIAFGGYQKLNERPKGEIEKSKALGQYTDALTFYAPKPAQSDLEKQFMAQVGSAIGTAVLNYFADEIGIHVRMTFSLKYEFGDDTWKTYPADYFEKNYAFHKRDFPWPQ